MEHSSVFSFKHSCSSHKVKFCKAHITIGEHGHKAFDVVITGASHRLTMTRTIKVMSLTADFKSMLAGIKNCIEVLITCYYFALFKNRIMCFNK